MKIKAYESFRWVPESAKTLPSASPREIKVKMVIAKAGQISGNGRKYVREELRKAARTLTGKPINVNHDDKRIIGNIDVAEYDDQDDQLEAIGTITSQMYADRVRANDPSWKGWSLQADYFFNKCAHCDQRFEDMEPYKNHLAKEHGLKNTFIVEPLGIHLNGVAYVESPEVPGLTGTTKQLMETVQKGLSQLWETIINDYEKFEEENNKMNKIVSSVKKEEATAVGLAPKLAEAKIKIREEDTSLKHDCPTGEEWDPVEGKCVLIEAPVKEIREPPKPAQPIPTLTVPASQTIILRESKGIEKLSLAEPCSPELKACVNALIIDGKEESSAWAICKSKVGETSKVKLTELKTRSFEDWRSEGLSEESSALRVKEVRIMSENNRKLEEAINGIMDFLQVLKYNETKVKESFNKIIDEVQKPIQTKDYDLVIAEVTAGLNKITEHVNALPKDDVSWKETVANLPKDDDSWKTRVEVLEKREIPQDDKSWEQKCATKEDLLIMQETQKEIAAIKESSLKDHEKLETLLTGLDKFAQQFKVLETENASLKQKVEEKTEKTVKETLELKEVVENLKTTTENLTDKLKGQFKGAHQKPEVSSTPIQSDPAKGGK